jgi:hypothetical protein
MNGGLEEKVVSDIMSYDEIVPLHGVAYPRTSKSPHTSNSSHPDDVHSQMRTQQKKLLSVQEEHAELLGLLAQQEMELMIFRKILEAANGVKMLKSADKKVKEAVVRRYGAYINYRGNDDGRRSPDDM